MAERIGGSPAGGNFKGAKITFKGIVKYAHEKVMAILTTTGFMRLIHNFQQWNSIDKGAQRI